MAGVAGLAVILALVLPGCMPVPVAMELFRYLNGDITVGTVSPEEEAEAGATGNAAGASSGDCEVVKLNPYRYAGY